MEQPATRQDMRELKDAILRMRRDITFSFAVYVIGFVVVGYLLLR